ncbi:response regulator [Hwanghaeella grinnelliae]|uniref:histidine kinase n=2 Tax=Hwanghaeella grinnelliae TaxID=2500179 RepID=A0A3S2VLZ6_9PROT|nr:response regulator [Hwanghaeella grinnelliae]
MGLVFRDWERSVPFPHVSSKELVRAMQAGSATVEATESLPWQVMIVDDDKSVHQSTRFALDDFEFENRGLELTSAYSIKEAQELLRKHRNTAVILLDVVMESETAGLDYVRWVRKELANSRVRIVLRTGQPGYAPELDVVRNFDINDYREKSQMTVNKLTATLYTALRSFRDIIQLEDQSERLQGALAMAEKANQAKTNFLAHVSHEFRTPLNGIIGLSEMIALEALGPIGTRKYSEYAWDIVTSGRHLQEMVERLLRFSESGGSRPIVQEAFDLRELISNLSGIGNTESLTTPVNEPGADEGEGDQRPGMMLRADKEAVQSMVSNLISNAVQHNPSGCRVRVTARPTDDGGLVLTVIDDGIGISESLLEQLDGSLAVPDDPYVAGRGGLGLGLVMTKSLIEAHGGSLKIESSNGNGTRAQLIFPPGSLTKVN